MELISRALRKDVLSLVQDLNGNHVIQKCAAHFRPVALIQFIFDAICTPTHFLTVATHRHGCCVIQRCVDYGADQQRSVVAQFVLKHALELSQDAFGNYVLQYTIEASAHDFFVRVVSKMLPFIAELSLQKFSSNVVEKVIKRADRVTRDRILAQLVLPEKLNRLLCDSYGNYVIETALACASVHYRQLMVESLQVLIEPLRNTPYMKRIHAKIIQAVQQRGAQFEKPRWRQPPLPSFYVGQS